MRVRDVQLRFPPSFLFLPHFLCVRPVLIRSRVSLRKASLSLAQDAHFFYSTTTIQSSGERGIKVGVLRFVPFLSTHLERGHRRATIQVHGWRDPFTARINTSIMPRLAITPHSLPFRNDDCDSTFSSSPPISLTSHSICIGDSPFFPSTSLSFSLSRHGPHSHIDTQQELLQGVDSFNPLPPID